MDAWVLFVLGLVLGIPLSIFANVATPWVVPYFKNRSLSSRQRRVIQIINRYERLADFRENRMKMAISLMYGLMITMALVASMVAFTLFDWSNLIIQATVVFFLVLISLILPNTRNQLEM